MEGRFVLCVRVADQPQPMPGDGRTQCARCHTDVWLWKTTIDLLWTGLVPLCRGCLTLEEEGAISDAISDVFRLGR